MEAFLKPILDMLIGWGPPGLIIIYLGYRNYNLELELTKSTEARIAEGRESVKTVAENTTALIRVAESQSKAADASKDLSHSIESMDKSIENFGKDIDRLSSDLKGVR